MLLPLASDANPDVEERGILPSFPFSFDGGLAIRIARDSPIVSRDLPEIMIPPPVYLRSICSPRPLAIVLGSRRTRFAQLANWTRRRKLRSSGEFYSSRREGSVGCSGLAGSVSVHRRKRNESDGRDATKAAGGQMQRLLDRGAVRSRDTPPTRSQCLFEEPRNGVEGREGEKRPKEITLFSTGFTKRA